MNGIIIAVFLIIVYSIFEGLHLDKIEKSKKLLEEDNKKKVELLKKQMNLIDELNEKLQKTGNDLIRMADCGKELSNDYAILCSILIDEIGIDETERKFKEIKTKQQTPVDLNEFIKKVCQ